MKRYESGFMLPPKTKEAMLVEIAVRIEDSLSHVMTGDHSNDVERKYTLPWDGQAGSEDEGMRFELEYGHQYPLEDTSPSCTITKKLWGSCDARIEKTVVKYDNHAEQPNVYIKDEQPGDVEKIHRYLEHLGSDATVRIDDGSRARTIELHPHFESIVAEFVAVPEETRRKRFSAFITQRQFKRRELWRIPEAEVKRRQKILKHSTQFKDTQQAVDTDTSSDE